MRLAPLFLLSTLAVSNALAQAPEADPGHDLAILHARVYAAPDAQPQNDVTILIHDGRITSVGKHVEIPKDVPSLQCSGCIVFAGFWNAHVHFMQPNWNDAAHQPAASLTSAVQAMLTHSGFTTVVDTGSDPVNTIALRRRIQSGEVLGPHIYTAGAPLYPPNALPYYLADLPAKVKALLGQPVTPEEAKKLVEQNIALGTDLVKVFPGSIVTPGHVVPMSVPIVRAAADTAHAHGQLVFAHPTNLEGMRIAMEGGVDVLAHAPDVVDGINNAFLTQIVAHHMAMVPTLMLFSKDDSIVQIREIVAKFHHDGGPLIFGTDTGFLTDFDLTEEYRQLSLTGLNFGEVLAMLTTAPAELFHVTEHKGRILPGMDADLTILSADPGSPSAAPGFAAFTQVRYTIRNGQIIFGKN